MVHNTLPPCTKITGCGADKVGCMSRTIPDTAADTPPQESIPDVSKASGVIRGMTSNLLTFI